MLYSCTVHLFKIQQWTLFRRVQESERDVRKSNNRLDNMTRNWEQDKLNFKRMSIEHNDYWKENQNRREWFLLMSLDRWRIIIQFNAQTVLAVPVIFEKENKSEGPNKWCERMRENQNTWNKLVTTGNREREREGTLDTFIQILFVYVSNNSVVVAERDPGFALRIYVVGKKTRVIGKNPCTKNEN